MSAPIAVTTPESAAPPALHASFAGIMRGEFLKIAGLFWLMLCILAAGYLFALVLQSTAPGLNLAVQRTPLQFLYETMEDSMTIFRILVGFFLLILTSFSIGREYQYGTIRILLARGAGRVQLLLAKLALLALLGLALVVLFALLTAAFLCLQVVALVGNLNAFHVLTPAFWSAIGSDLLAVMISMGTTILLAAAMNSLGRSLTIGLSVSLVWFPIDNFGVLVLNEIAELTHSDFWRALSSSLLGPLLNRLPDVMVPNYAQTAFASFGAPPLVPMNGPHALLVVCGYALVFLALALLVTWKRDVKE
jgi:ABC-2 type transport system permease protein